MKSLACILVVLFSASICEAACPGGHCPTPVRTAVKATAKGVVKVARAPFKCRCRGCKGCCKG